MNSILENLGNSYSNLGKYFFSFVGEATSRVKNIFNVSLAALDQTQKIATAVTSTAEPLLANISDAYFMALPVVLAGGFFARSGIKDIRSGKYIQGTCKALIGITGMVAAGYFVYDSFYKEARPTKSESKDNWTWDKPKFKSKVGSDSSVVDPFLEKHRKELESPGRFESPNWRFIGEGECKYVVKHLGLPNHVIKFQLSLLCCEGAVEREYLNMQRAYEIIDRENLNLMVVPETHLFKAKGTPRSIEMPFLIQEEFNMPTAFEDLLKVVRGRDSYKQLETLKTKGRFFDLSIGHNVNFLFKDDKVDSPEALNKVGVYDLDESQRCLL